MITYFPWSEAVLKECLAVHDKGGMATLDLELTAKCTSASCVYCDSRPNVGARYPDELNLRETENLLEQGKKLGLRWVFSCGLGEPLEDRKFMGFIEKAASLNIRVSLFTNGIAIDGNMARWLRDNRVCLIVKLDSLVEETFDTLLGKKGTARKVYRAVEELLAAGYGADGSGPTELAFSIVPTKLSLGGIGPVVQYAKEHNVFPSVGELEQAGRALERNAYQGMAVDGAGLASLKREVEGLLWKGYTRPICPAIVTGVHIDNIGKCVVDRETGLNCKWFLLREPLVKEIGSVRSQDLADLFEKVRAYRKKCFERNENGLRRCAGVEYVFGGCGGSPSKIVRIAREHV